MDDRRRDQKGDGVSFYLASFLVSLHLVGCVFIHGLYSLFAGVVDELRTTLRPVRSCVP